MAHQLPAPIPPPAGYQAVQELGVPWWPAKPGQPLIVHPLNPSPTEPPPPLHGRKIESKDSFKGWFIVQLFVHSDHPYKPTKHLHEGGHVETVEEAQKMMDRILGKYLGKKDAEFHRAYMWTLYFPLEPQAR